MQKTHEIASSSTALCKQRSRDYKSQEIQEMQCVMRDAANSRCCLHQYASPQPTVGWDTQKTHEAISSSTAYLCCPQILQKRKKGISRMKCRKRNEAQDRQQTQDSISSTALCDTRSRRWKSWEMQQIQTGTKDAENSWFSKQQYGFMQTTFAWLQVARNTGNAMWHQRCSKLTMLPSSVRTSATQYRIFMLASDSAKKV